MSVVPLGFHFLVRSPGSSGPKGPKDRRSPAAEAAPAPVSPHPRAHGCWWPLACCGRTTGEPAMMLAKWAKNGIGGRQVGWCPFGPKASPTKDTLTLQTPCASFAPFGGAAETAAWSPSKQKPIQAESKFPVLIDT